MVDMIEILESDLDSVGLLAVAIAAASGSEEVSGE